MKIYLVTTIGPDIKYLDRFFGYYQRLGVDQFIVTNHQPYPDFSYDILQGISKVCNRYNVKGNGSWHGHFSEDKKIEIENKAKNEVCDDQDWVIYADSDEFHYFDPPLRDQINYCSEHFLDSIEGRLLDRVYSSGDLPLFKEEYSLEEIFSLGGFITHYLLGAWDKKVMAAKASRDIGGGHHVLLRENGEKVNGYRTETYFPEVDSCFSKNFVHHFKWEHDLLHKLKVRTVPTCNSLKSWAQESKKFLAYIEKYKRIIVENPVYNFQQYGHHYLGI